MEVTISKNDLQILKEILQIAPFMLKMYKDVAKNGVKTALSDNLDANLETLCSSSFTETNHTDFILNSLGEYKSLRRCDDVDPVKVLLDAIAGIQQQIECIKTGMNTENSYNVERDTDVKNIKAQVHSLSIELNNGFNESINAIQELKAGVSLSFSDAMANHLGSLTRNSTLTLNSLEDIKKTLANGEYSRNSYGQGSILNPLYQYASDNAPAVTWNPEPSTVKEDVENALAGMWQSPVSHPMTSNIMMEDVFKLADKLDTEEGYSYYLDTEQHTSSSIGILGAQIKANSAIPPEYSLFKESINPEPDIRIHDMDLVALHNTPHLYALPPVTGG